MWKQMVILFTLVIALFYFCVLRWLNVPTHTLVNPCTVEDLVEDPEAMEKAVKKMGPYYHYIITTEGDLYVNRGDGNWLKLRYRKGE